MQAVSCVHACQNPRLTKPPLWQYLVEALLT